MSKTLTQIVNTDTFGTWKDRTNEIISELASSIVTLNDAIDSPEKNTGFIEITSYLKATEGRFSGAEGISADKIQSFTNGAPIDFSGDLELTGKIDIISTAASNALNPADNIIRYYLNDDETWSIGPNGDHTQFWIIGSDATTGDASTAKLYLDDTINQLRGTVTINPELLSGSYNISATKFTNPITINFTGDVSGSVTFDGETTPVSTTNLTVAASSADKWTTARKLTLSSDSDVRITNAGVPVTTSGANPTPNGGILLDGSTDITEINIQVNDDSHSHTIANIDDLSTTLAGKYSTTGGTLSGNVTVDSGGNGKVQITTGANPANGTITTTGDITAFGSVSDINRKENIQKIENALDKVSQISGYTFNYIGDDRKMTGVIAQEVEEVLPEVVYDTWAQDGTETKAVRHSNMVGLIIEAIKELREEIESLKNKQ